MVTSYRAAIVDQPDRAAELAGEAAAFAPFAAGGAP